MAKWGKCDFKQLRQLQKNMQKMAEKGETAKFCEECARELAARLLRMVIKETPTGDYSIEVEYTAKRNSKHHKKGDIYTKRINPSGKMGGTLKRGWTAQTEKDAENGNSKDAKEWADSLNISKEGDTYKVEIVNPVHYASYVEYGHRQEPGRYVAAIGKKLKKSWVNGKFMLTKSEKNLEQIAPKIIEEKIAKFLEGCFDDL